MSLTFVVRTPDGVVAPGGCDQVVVPTLRGEMGVLAKHAPLVARVAPGEMRITAGGQQTRIRVSAGLVEVLDDVVTLFVADAGQRVKSGNV